MIVDINFVPYVLMMFSSKSRRSILFKCCAIVSVEFHCIRRCIKTRTVFFVSVFSQVSNVVVKVVSVYFVINLFILAAAASFA